MTEDFEEFEEKKSLNRKFMFERRERENYYLVNVDDPDDAYFYVGGKKYIKENKVYKEEWLYISREMCWLKNSYQNKIKHRFE